jgi:APA family basic amino acid/polyamine antiporter
MKRLLGLGFGLAVIVGGTIGIGILRTPGLIAAALPSPAAILTVWLVGGLYTLLGAICLTELGTMMPAAGGYYVYARKAFGDAVGFAVGWTDWLTYCAVTGYVSIGMAEFVGTLVPSVATQVTPLALAILGAFVLLQWAGLAVSSRFQTWTTVLKAAAFLGLVVAAAVWPGARTAGTLGPPAVTLAGTIAAFQAVVITFGGWQSALYFTEEDTDPERHLPRAMIGGVALVIVIYLLVNLALLRVLPIPDLARSVLPAATAAQALAGPTGARAITLVSLLSLPPLLNVIVMIGARILFALGRDGLFWSGAARVTPRGTLGPATLVTTGVAAVLIATGTFTQLVALTSLFLAANYCVCCAALMRLRAVAPEARRPFRAWLYPWSAWIVLLGAAAFVASTVVGDPRNGSIGLAFLAAGLAIGVVWKGRRRPSVA